MESETFERIKQDRRMIDSLSNVQILKDTCWDEHCKKWYLKISIEIEQESEHIPKITNWYIVLDSNYPNGVVEIFPDVENGITATFQHQSNNFPIEKNELWKKGKLCLNTDISSLKFINTDNGSNPILWNIKRAINWLTAASTNSLVNNKSLFEFPEYIEDNNDLFVFSEDEMSFTQWKEIDEKYGIAWLGIYKENPKIYFVKSFDTTASTSTYVVEWGDFFKQNFPIEKAAWILLDEIPVLNVWQSPCTYEELEQCFTRQCISLEKCLDALSPELRDEKEHILLIGFPIPKYYGSKNENITWKALWLPKLTNYKRVRDNEKSLRQFDKQFVFKSEMPLNWIKSENWNLSQISQRGKLNQEIVFKKTLIIGAGCVGSTLSELLVRAGMCDLTIIDNDNFMAGNLCRHTLGLIDIGNNKSDQLSERLNRINPHTKVTSLNFMINSDVITTADTNQKIDLSLFDIIIDCSGSSKVLKLLEEYSAKTGFKENIILASVSLSLEAQYLYLGLWKSNPICVNTFINIISEYFNQDELKYSEYEFPRDGTGCWTPTFPARIDDIWSIVSTAVNAIETFIISNSFIPSTSDILIFEKTFHENYFNGYHLKRVG